MRHVQAVMPRRSGNVSGLESRVWGKSWRCENALARNACNILIKIGKTPKDDGVRTGESCCGD